MTIVDLISVPVVSTPQLSPDGTQVVYVQADADWKANKRVTHIWRVRTDGTGTAQLTSGKDGETQPRWSPDGKCDRVRRQARRRRDRRRSTCCRSTAARRGR